MNRALVIVAAIGILCSSCCGIQVRHGKTRNDAAMVGLATIFLLVAHEAWHPRPPAPCREEFWWYRRSYDREHIPWR